MKFLKLFHLKAENSKEYACVLFTQEKRYAVIKCSLVKKDSKGQSFIREKGKNFEIVILCIGSRDAGNKRTALIEKTMETDANDYNSSS